MEGMLLLVGDLFLKKRSTNVDLFYTLFMIPNMVLIINTMISRISFSLVNFNVTIFLLLIISIINNISITTIVIISGINKKLYFIDCNILKFLSEL